MRQAYHGNILTGSARREAVSATASAATCVSVVLASRSRLCPKDSLFVRKLNANSSDTGATERGQGRGDNVERMGRSRHVDAGPLAHDTIIFLSSFFFFPSKEGGGKWHGGAGGGERPESGRVTAARSSG